MSIMTDDEKVEVLANTEIVLYIYLYVSENTIVDIHFCIVIRNIVSSEFRMN
jgi:hypothetical protein